MIRCHYDIETRSECNLKAAGLYRYAEDPTTEVIMLSYRFGYDGPMHFWLPFPSYPAAFITAVQALRGLTGALHLGPTCPPDLKAHVEGGGKMAAHHFQFERTVLNGPPGQRIGFPRVEIAAGICTAVKSSANGLPRSLEEAAKALGTYPKKVVGRNDMLALSKPRRGAEKWYTPENDPERWIRVCDYCMDDTYAESDLDRNLPDLSPSERDDYLCDQEMNDRGVAVDLESVNAIRALVAEYKAELEALCAQWTGFRPSQNGEIANWVRTHGYPQLENLQAETVRLAVLDATCSKEVKRVLQLYSTYNLKTVVKFETMANMVCKDGRLHGFSQFHAAHTGRCSSVGVQLHNLFRTLIADPDTAIEAARLRDLGLLRWLYQGIDPMKVLSSCVRGVLVAAPGKELFSVDLAGIESRYATWMFDENWKLDVFRRQDAGGPDNYVVAYERTFGQSLKGLDKKDPRFQKGRQGGKVVELAFAFEGGLTALGTAAEAYQLNLDEMAEAIYPLIESDVMDSALWMIDNFGTRGFPHKTAVAGEAVKIMWRKQHPAHVVGWKRLCDCFVAACRSPGVVFSPPNKKVHFKVENDILKVRLPSGRVLRYRKPELQGNPERPDLTYVGVDTDTRQYKRTKTYGGKLCENIAQAGSCDLLRHGMKVLKQEGLPIVMSVHDEAVVEVELGTCTEEQVKAAFTRPPAWAKGLPLASGVWHGYRYRK